MIALRGSRGASGGVRGPRRAGTNGSFHRDSLGCWIGKSVLAGFPIDGVTMTVSGGWLGETLRIMVKTRIVRNKF